MRSKKCLFGLFMLAPLALHASPQMVPGGWELRSRITAVNTDTGEKRDAGEQVVRMCLTPEFLARDPYLTPKLDEAKMAQRKAKCDTQDFQREGASASWTMRCELADGSSLNARIRNEVAPESLHLRMEQAVVAKDRRGNVVMDVQGRRQGDCTDEMIKP